MSAHVSPAKKESVKKVKQLCKHYPIIGIVDLQSLPSAQLQKMRKKLGKEVEIFVTKKNIINIAFEELKAEKKGIEHLEKYLNGIPALLLTKENPFKLYSLLQKSKTKAAAKPGQKAPNEIKISAGPTPFAPGPIISELGSAGLKTSVKEGKVAILQDKVVAKEGDVITATLASLLQRLGIEPMEIGLNLVAVFENGSIFGKDVLAIDETVYLNNIVKAQQQAFNLAMEAGITNKETVDFMIQKAFKQAKTLALEANILEKEVIGEILAKAERQMQAIKSKS